MSEKASSSSAVATEKPKQAAPAKAANKPKRLPPYNVVLINDDDHTYDYVIEMLGSLFGHGKEKAFKMAKEVDETGRVIVLTTTKEHAELKRDQIHAFGPDKRMQRCRGSMSAQIEPAPQ